jgi:hypothetical protein
MTPLAAGTILLGFVGAIALGLIRWPLRQRFKRLGRPGKLIAVLLPSLAIFLAAVTALWWREQFHLSRPEPATGAIILALASAVALYLIRWPLRQQFARLGLLGKSIVVLFLILAIFFAAVLALWWWEKYQLPRPLDDTRPLETKVKWNFWLQVMVGKWLPANIPYPTRSFAYSLSAMIAFVLTFGPIGGAITYIVKFVKPLLEERNELMKVTDYYRQRDQVVIATIIRLLPSDLPEGLRDTLIGAIREGFEKGDETWVRDFLPIPFKHASQDIAARLAKLEM